MKSLLLCLIVALFLLTRLYQIEQIPVSLYWDEASIGYNAYSILKTGADEWGKRLPIHFRAFGEFKLPVYIYSTVVTESLFGPRVLAVRLPAVFFSLLLLVFTYLLALELVGDKKVALWASFFLSISPWLFIFSRTGYEATAGLAFFLAGVYFLFKFLRNIWYLPLSTLSMIASLYSYNSFRIIVPISLLFLVGLISGKLGDKSRKVAIVGLLCLITFLISLIPIVRLVVLDQGAVRLQTVGILNHSDSLAILVGVLKNYLSHFSLSFLFFAGDKNLRSQIPNFGQLYLIDFPLILCGLLSIFSRSKEKNYKSFLMLFMIIIAPLPAAITYESPHALRSITAVPFIAILSAQGACWAIMKMKKFFLLPYLLVTVYLVFFSNYFYHFISFYPKLSAFDWQSPYKQLFSSGADFNKYSQIYITDSFGQPYIFALFYLNYDPTKLWQTVQYNPIDQWGFSTVKHFDKFTFHKVSSLGNIPTNSLVLTTPEDKIPFIQPKKIIYDIDGRAVLYQYEH